MNYPELIRQLEALLEGQHNWWTNLSQFSAFVNDHMDDINWVGFYLLSQPGHLKLGPFQGRVACVDIPFGRGVCGTAAQTGEVQLIADVHQFAGHIACDARSNSEVVIPLVLANEVIGVLDIDSPSFSRFSLADAEGLQKLIDVLLRHTDFPETFG